MDKVSVIIPTKNRAQLLKESLESIMRQTQPVFEVVVVDMLSEDNSAQVVSSFGKKVKFFSKPFKNQSESRNFGIKIAKGDLIAFLDSDDWWLQKKIEEQVDFMEENKKYSFCYTDAVAIDVTGVEIPTSYVYHYQKENLYVGKIAEKLFRENNTIPTSSVMARKNILEKIGGFDERLSYHEDRDLWIRLSLEGEAGFIDKILTAYRSHPQQFTKDQEKLREQQWDIVIDKYSKFKF
jgi:glycosyltransferase involved in cell wall biosynthesis